MYLPAGSIGAQFAVEGSVNSNYKIYFLDNNPATVELAKRWVTFLSGLNLEQEIDETIAQDSINNYQKVIIKSVLVKLQLLIQCIFKLKQNNDILSIIKYEYNI